MRKNPKRRGPADLGSERPPKLLVNKAARHDSISSSSEGNNTASAVLVCGLLLLAVAVVFVQTGGHEFVNIDDNEYVYENWHVQQGLTLGGAAWAAGFHALNWHPLTWLSHMLDCQLFGTKPAGHHLASALLHGLAAVVLFLAFRRMTGAIWPSAMTAAIFAVHPLRVESVAWVAERKDVLSGLLFMLTLFFYARYAERAASWRRYFLFLAAFALGLMAKPMLISLPLVLLLLDYWPLGRWRGAGNWGSRKVAPRDVRGLLVEKVPLFVLAAVSGLVTIAAQRSAIHTWAQQSFAARAANAVIAYVAYLGKMVFPAELAAMYPLPKEPPPGWHVAVAASVLLAISAACFAARRNCPYLLVGWLWYLATLVPVIGLVQVGSQAMADRYTYLTQIGLYAAIAWGAADMAGVLPYRRILLAACATTVLAALMVFAWRQARHWRDGESLWSHTLACEAENPLAENNLALVLARRGRSDEARVHYAKALQLQPDFAEAHNNLGLLLAEQGHGSAAIDQYLLALKIKPACAEAHFNLGRALTERGRTRDAIAEYRLALGIKPDYVAALVNLGNDLADVGQPDDAIAAYRQSLAIRPDSADAHYNLANALARMGTADDAIAHYRSALQIKPDYAEAQFNLAGILERRGEIDEAIAHYQNALSLLSARGDKDRVDWLRAKLERLRSNGKRLSQ